MQRADWLAGSLESLYVCITAPFGPLPEWVCQHFLLRKALAVTLLCCCYAAAPSKLTAEQTRFETDCPLHAVCTPGEVIT